MKVEVRLFKAKDLPDMQHYFFHSTPEFLESIGLKPRGSDDEREFAAAYAKRFAEDPSPVKIVTVLVDGRRVGVHTSTHFVAGESLTMHAHYFFSDARGRGFGTKSYVLAMELFFATFGVKEILFKTPIMNKAPMRIKEKLGLTPIGSETIDWPVLTKPLETRVFRVTPDMLPELRVRAGL